MQNLSLLPFICKRFTINPYSIGLGEFNEITVPLPADGVEIIVVPALAVAIGR